MANNTVYIWEDHECEGGNFEYDDYVSPFSVSGTENDYLEFGNIDFVLNGVGTLKVYIKCTSALVYYESNGSNTQPSYNVNHSVNRTGNLLVELYNSNGLYKTLTITPHCYTSYTNINYVSVTFSNLNPDQYYFKIKDNNLMYGPFNYTGSGEAAYLQTTWDIYYETNVLNKIATIQDCRDIDSKIFKDNLTQQLVSLGQYRGDNFTVTNNVSITSVTLNGTSYKALMPFNGGIYKLVTFTTPSEAEKINIYFTYLAQISGMSGYQTSASNLIIYIVKGTTFYAGAPGFKQLGTFIPVFKTTAGTVNYSADVEPNTTYSIFLNDGPKFKILNPKNNSGTTITSGTYTATINFNGIGGPFFKSVPTNVYNPNECPPQRLINAENLLDINNSYEINQLVKLNDLSLKIYAYISALYFNTASYILKCGSERTLSVTKVVNGKGYTANNSELTWASSNTSVATVINGVVKANTADYEGTTVITASTTNTASGTAISTSYGCKITVERVYLNDFLGIITCNTNGFENVVSDDWFCKITVTDCIPSKYIGTRVWFKVYDESKVWIDGHPGGSSYDWSFDITEEFCTGTAFPKPLDILPGSHYMALGGTKDRPAKYAKITDIGWQSPSGASTSNLYFDPDEYLTVNNI